jgi:phospholipase C
VSDPKRPWCVVLGVLVALAAAAAPARGSTGACIVRCWEAMMKVCGVLSVLLSAGLVAGLRTPPDADLSRPAAASHEEFAAEVVKMRDTMHTMTREEQDKRLAEIKHFGRELERDHQDKIEHFIVLFMENRAADHTFGCMLGDNPEFDGIPKEGLQIMKDPTDPSAGNVTVTCGTAPYVCKGGMGFSSNGHFKPGADQKVYPYGEEGNEWDYANGAKSEAIEMFSGEQLPIKKAVSENFAVFVRLCPTVS